MDEHKFHELIGEKIVNAGLESCTIVRDTACGGNHTLPLFCSPDKSNKTEFCDVDMLIIKNNKIKVIFEIEESNVKPLHIFGKFLASGLSSSYVYKNEYPIDMAENVLFIQILDSSNLPDGTSKKAQWENIEKSIQNIIITNKDKKPIPIIKYKLIYGSTSDFEKDAEKSRELIESIQTFLKEN